MKLLSRMFRCAQLGLWRQPVNGPFGTHLYGPPLDGTFQMIVRNAYGNFTYDSLRAAAPSCTFLDIGANIGLYTVAMGTHFTGPKFAFEPNFETFGYLQENLHRAGLTEVHAMCAAIAEEDQTSAVLNLRKFHSGAASMVNSFNHIERRISLISPTTLKSLLSTDRPIVCKIDVEGAELSVVNCLKNASLLSRCERVCIEMSLGTNSEFDLSLIRGILGESGLILRDRSGTDHFGDELFTR